MSAPHCFQSMYTNHFHLHTVHTPVSHYVATNLGQCDRRLAPAYACISPRFPHYPPATTLMGAAVFAIRPHANQRCACGAAGTSYPRCRWSPTTARSWCGLSTPASLPSWPPRPTDSWSASRYSHAAGHPAATCKTSSCSGCEEVQAGWLVTRWVWKAAEAKRRHCGQQCSGVGPCPAVIVIGEMPAGPFARLCAAGTAEAAAPKYLVKGSKRGQNLH